MGALPSKNFLSSEIKKAMTDGQSIYAMALLDLIKAKYMLHEVDEALKKIGYELIDDNSGESLLLFSILAWAIWAHAGPCGSAALAETHLKVAQAGMATLAAREGSDKVQGYKEEIFKTAVTHLAQAASFHAYQAVSCRNVEGVDTDELKAAAALEMKAAAAFLKAWGAAPANLNAEKPKQMIDAFIALLKPMGFEGVLGDPRIKCVY
eukprot:gene6991-61_t